eukprot:1254160-Pleurochrysis_carterae.AAC.1
MCTATRVETVRNSRLRGADKFVSSVERSCLARLVGRLIRVSRARCVCVFTEWAGETYAQEILRASMRRREAPRARDDFREESARRRYIPVKSTIVLIIKIVHFE